MAGMGGIGKTALAQQYVREAKKKYPGGRWYFKVREQGLVTQVVSAAAVFGWQLPDDLPDDRARVKWCYNQWCRQYPGMRLLLLDDVKRFGDVKNLLPQDDESFRVLMTSRRRFQKPVDRLDLGKLAVNEAMELLSQLVGDSERVRQQRTEAEALCEWVGWLPLGVELIARYLALHSNLSFAKLQERLENKRLEARALRQASEEVAYDQLEDYEKPIEVAFELSWQDLETEAKTLMGLLSIFAAAQIPSGLIVDALPEWDEEDLEDLLDAILVQRNLLQRDADGSYQLHQLIREFTTIKLETELSDQTPALQKSVAIVVSQFASTVEPTITLNKQKIVALVVPHMVLVAKELNSVLSDDEEPGWVFTGLARFYEQQILWSEAEYWYREHLKMSEQRSGSEYLDIAASLDNLAQLYRVMGRYTKAEELCMQSLEMREKQFGPEHLLTATVLHNLGFLYEVMGQYVKAEPLYIRSLKISENQLGSEHPDIATQLNNLAMLYEAMGQYLKAKPLYIRSLEIRESLLGPEHPDTADTLNNLAELYNAMGQYVKAEPLYVRSLKISENQLGSEHPSTATSLNNLAGLYKATNRYAEAESLYARTIAIFGNQLGSEHPSTATSLNNLGNLYRSMKRYAEAESLLLRSLNIRENQLGSEHPNTATSLNDLAHLYLLTERYAEAESLLLRSLNIRENQLGPEHPDTAQSYSSMTAFLYKLERYAESANFCVKASEICLNTLGIKHPDTLASFNYVAAILQKVIETNQTEQLSNHPLTQKILSSLERQNNPKSLLQSFFKIFRRTKGE